MGHFILYTSPLTLASVAQQSLEGKIEESRDRDV